MAINQRRIWRGGITHISAAKSLKIRATTRIMRGGKPRIRKERTTPASLAAFRASKEIS